MRTLAKFSIAALVAVVAVGCATAGGKSDEDQISDVINAWKAGVEAQNIDQATANYSDNYQDAQASSKADIIQFMKGIKDQGMLENAKVSDKDAKISIDKDEATAGPYDVTSDAGGWTLDIYLKKEAGGWKIVSVDVY